MPQKNSMVAGHLGADINNSLAGILFFGVVPALYIYAAESLLGFGVSRRQRRILLIPFDPFRQPGDLSRIFAVHQLFQRIHLIQMAGFQHIQPCHLHIQVSDSIKLP